MSLIQSKPPVSTQQGVGLIEVLVALLMISIGVLGLTALQANGLKNNREAYYRTQATVLAYDIIDRMRANSDQIALYTAGANPVSNVSGIRCTSACSTAAIVTNDLLDWQGDLAAQLPAGDGTITAIGINGAFNVTVSWTDNDNNTMSLSIGAQL
jgi:type IV pilus assembly protein PilV